MNFVNGVFQSEFLSVCSKRAVQCEGELVVGRERKRGDCETEEQREAETERDGNMKNSSPPQQ